MHIDTSSSPSQSQRAVFILNGCLEFVLLSIVCASPWAYGAVGVQARFYLLIAIAALVVLWVIRLLLSNSLDWRHCPVAICIAATLLLGILQITPMRRAWMSAVAPGTARLLLELLPESAEAMPPPSNFINVGWSSAGSMLSLYPGETRAAILPFLAILLLFLVVRNNPLNAGATKRLCFALFLNGAALALFALIQFFSTPERGKIYWTYQSQGSAFGPFINRNHFAFYMNLCIGPSLGLLLASRTAATFDTSMSRIQRGLNGLRELLLSPAALWLGCGIGLMLTSVVFCLSRGGVLALFSGATICAVWIVWIGARNLRLATVLLSICIAFGLLMWFGFESIENRIGTLWSGEALKDGRVYVMSRAWPLVSQFPLFGTGMGTFPHVEPLALHGTEDVGSLYEHAHNDYLEDLIEGGIIRLGLRIAAIAFVFKFAMNAYRHKVGGADGALVLGLLFAFATVVLHSFFEFGLYVPAIAVIATVICGHLCNLGDDPVDVDRSKEPWHVLIQRAGMLAAVAGCSLIAWLFWVEGSKAITLSRLEDELTSEATTALQMVSDNDLESSIPLAYQMANLYPLDAAKRFVIAEIHFHLYKRLAGQKDNPLATTAAERQLETALQHTVHARNLCPILAEPNTRLAAHAEVFSHADTKSAYMNRAKRLAPADAQLWYLCGLQELADGQADTAWESWRQSLSLSDVGLSRILDRSLAVLTPEEILAKVLPDRASVLLAAAMYFYPDPESAEERKPFLEKALALVSIPSKKLNVADLQTRATVFRLLGRQEEALTTYRDSLAADPEQLATRLQLATLLLELNRAAEARHELGLILGQQPNHHEAKALLEEITRGE